MLLPGFLFVTFVITVRQVGDSVRMQRLSSREPGAVDFRRVQGGVAACGVGTLLSGIAGTLPGWPYMAGITLATGAEVAARTLGVVIGAILVGLAFVPKLTALIISVPPPVLGAYIIVIFGITFAEGMRIVFQEGVERVNAMIAGLSFWVGAGIQFQAIFPEHFATPTARMLANGLTAGGLTILVLNLFLVLTGPRRHRVEVALRPESLPELDRFLVEFAARHRWNTSATERLRAASEEALLCLSRAEETGDGHDTPEPGSSPDPSSGRRLRVVARSLRHEAMLDFTAATRTANLENEMVLLGTRPDPSSQRDLSLRLLRQAPAVPQRGHPDSSCRQGVRAAGLTGCSRPDAGPSVRSRRHRIGRGMCERGARPHVGLTSDHR